MNQTWKDRGNTGQLLDFTHLSYDYELNKVDLGPLHPTDIDAVFEIHNTRRHPLKQGGVLFFEYKCRDVTMGMSSGQAVLFETLCRRLAETGIIARTLEIRHYVYDADEDIDAGACEVYRIYDGTTKQWTRPEEPITAAEYLDDFINECRGDATEKSHTA